MADFKRYAVVREKFAREVVLLKSLGCVWGGCFFCDYKSDFDKDPKNCAAFNRAVLKKVDGRYGALQVIDSASFSELPDETADNIIHICRENKIRLLIAEQHWRYREQIPAIRRRFARHGIACKFIIGLETFDGGFRESALNKGMGFPDPKEIAEYFSWANLLFGLRGQSLSSLRADIETGLKFFERLTLNLFVPNSTRFERDGALAERFYSDALFERVKDADRIEILDVLDARAPDGLGGVGYPESGEKVSFGPIEFR
ncbi:MAG: hypothetical protein LBP79_02885 [Clostridiales bacterium]|nr:hypothetical protein [Clostridiales bacterium]